MKPILKNLIRHNLNIVPVQLCRGDTRLQTGKQKRNGIEDKIADCII